MQKILLRKGIIFTIVVLFIGLSVVSSTGNIVEDVNTYLKIIDSVESLGESSVPKHIAYAPSPYNNFSVLFEFELPYFSNITYLCPNISINYWGMTWCHINKRIYATEDNGNISIIDLEACDIEYLGSSGTSEIVDLSYDPNRDTLYGISTHNLYEINMENGSATFIGPMGTSSLMFCLDCDRRGNMYGLDYSFSNSCLYSINTSTGHATIIGNLGGTFISFPELAYDKDNDIMYIIFFNMNTFRPELHIINVTTGHSSYLGPVSYGISVFTIPYYYIWNQPPSVEIINPKEGYFHLSGIPLLPTPLNLIADTISLGGFRLNPIVINATDDIDKSEDLMVKIYLDGEYQGNASYCCDWRKHEWFWTGWAFGNYILKITAEDSQGEIGSEEIKVFNFCFLP